MSNCKFLRQKKQVQINGEWVDTRSYRYVPYCDGRTPYVTINGGKPNNTIEILGNISTETRLMSLDDNGNGRNELLDTDIISGMKYPDSSGAKTKIVEFVGCNIASFDTFRYTVDTLIISCSTYIGNYVGDTVHTGFECKKLIFKGFDLSHYISKPFYFSVFYSSSSLESIEGLSTVDISNVTSFGSDGYGLFEECKRLKFLDLSVWDVSKITQMYKMCYNCKSLESIDLSGWNTSKVTNMRSMFYGCNSLTSLDVSHFDTSNVKYMDNMFNGCSGLTSLDVSHFNTNNVIDMSSMFNGCSGITSLDVSHFDTSNVKYMDNMFNGCSGLTSLDVSHFNTNNVTHMNGMFKDCSGITSLDVSGFNASKIQNVSSMFENCASLTSLDLSGWNLRFEDNSNYDNYMEAMFKGCTNLKFLDLSGWDVRYSNSKSELFMYCSSLETLDLSGWNQLSKNTEGPPKLFLGCKNLKTIYMRNCGKEIVESVKNQLKKAGILDQVTIIT